MKMKWPWSRKQPSRKPNPWIGTRGFYSGDEGRLLTGWTSQSSSVDYYLYQDLTTLRARSREFVRKNAYGSQYVRVMRKNIIGNAGVQVQSHTKMFRNGREMLDERANEAIESAWKDWCRHHADWKGACSFLDMQRMAINSAAQDGEFIYRKRYGLGAGKYGFQLEEIDPELLDVDKNERSRTGGEIRLGVEYDQRGRVVRYWFREKDESGNYHSGRRYAVSAKYIIHGYMREFPDQSRGIPWSHAILEDSKHFEKYEESAMVAARKGAMLTGYFKSTDPNDQYQGEEEGEGHTITQLENGEIRDIGNRDYVGIDPAYPHQMYEPFTRARLSRLAAGSGVSYESLSGDLKGATYSSMRMGALDEREYYKELQDWFISSFVEPVFMEWLTMAYTMDAITIGNRPLSRPLEDYMRAHFQPRRWDWVDPAKEANAHEMAIKHNLKSRSQIIREQGNDPDTIWREIQRERELFREMGIEPQPDGVQPVEDDDE